MAISAGRIGRRLLRELAALPLRVLGSEDRTRLAEQLAASLVTEVDVGSGSLRFMTPTPLLQARARSLLLKEPDTIRWIDGFGAQDVLWDIGANVGVFALYAARRRGVRVLAFEPSASNYMVLCRNIELSALGDLVRAFCVAFAGDTQLGILNLGTHEIGGAVNQFGQQGEWSRYLPNAAGAAAQGMIGYSIDEFIARFNPPFPTHIKIDVDGLEGAILQGAKITLNDPRLRSLMTELNVTDTGEFDRVAAFLSQAGFELSHRGARQESGDEAAANHFFTRRHAAPYERTI